jgi:hypothetical protein
MLLDRTYSISPKGLATSFIETEVPPDYAITLRNRFLNTAGGAEMRQGIRQYGMTVAGSPNLTAIHELVKKDGASVRFVDGGGSLYRYDGASTWTVVRSNIDTTNRLHSIQFDDKLIFDNGTDRNFYTEDGITFTELLAKIAEGTMAAVTANGFEDSSVGDWVIRGARVNDLVHNVTRGTFSVVTGIVTANTTASVASAAALGRLVHTPMGASGRALGEGVNNAAGDLYRLIDLVELNVIPTNGDPDNTGTLAAPATPTTIGVSGLTNWPGTETRVGDYFYNTTRSAVARVSAIASGQLTVTSVPSQVTADSGVFLKSAMPIASHTHNHFGYVFYIDARDRRKIRISGPGDPQDMTNGATLDASTFKFGGLQPQGDYVVDMTSFQRFLVLGGKKNIFLYSGVDPLDTANFTPVGLFPQGVAAEGGLISIGNDAAFLTGDGVQSVSMASDASTLNRANISEAIKSTIREELQTTPESGIKCFHYSRRSWLMIKIGARIYNFNYTTYLGRQQGLSPQGGSWSVFDGKFAQQNDYKIMSNGDLLCCGPGGKVYIFDQGDYQDDGGNYTTEFESAHLKPHAVRGSPAPVSICQGQYIKPIFDVGGNVAYTIEAEGDYDSGMSSDSISIATSAGAAVGNFVVGTSKIGGSTVNNVKESLRWRGEAVKLRFTTEGGTGPDVLSRFTVYFSRHGKQ